MDNCRLDWSGYGRRQPSTATHDVVCNENQRHSFNGLQLAMVCSWRETPFVRRDGGLGTTRSFAAPSSRRREKRWTGSIWLLLRDTQLRILLYRRWGNPRERKWENWMASWIVYIYLAMRCSSEPFSFSSIINYPELSAYPPPTIEYQVY
jgi:hypothetical protein